jgi:hypothetical protein
MVEKIPASEWLTRCVQRIRAADKRLDGEDAEQLAVELLKFERTAAMEPELAVDFVLSELARPNPRFERRYAPRE